RITVESVARCSWNGWPDDRGIRILRGNAGCSWHLLMGLIMRLGGVYETRGDSNTSFSQWHRPRKRT
ncbi:hypothetical protein E5D53_32600, partial [Pseudomonas aeruginosa]